MPHRFRVCFVCTGNICRSPSAEIVFRTLVAKTGLAERISCDSAGLGDWHLGDGADPRSLAALTARGYEGVTGHRARQWGASWWAERDLVVAMDSGHAAALSSRAPKGRSVVLLRDFDPLVAGQHMDVPDPYHGGTQGFEDVLTMIERSCAGLLEEIQLHHLR